MTTNNARRIFIATAKNADHPDFVPESKQPEPALAHLPGSGFGRLRHSLRWEQTDRANHYHGHRRPVDPDSEAWSVGEVGAMNP